MENEGDFRNKRFGEYETRYNPAVDELRSKGVFITGGEEPIKYKCLFYHTRKCSTREQMGITDEGLNEYILTEKTARVMVPLQGTPEHSRGEEKEKLIADWIVNYFCRLCPHRMK